MSSADFEWQTDEEEDRLRALPVVESRVRGRWRMPWRLLVVGMLLATTISLGIRWRTTQQTAAIAADVQIAHALLQEAELAQDVEMLNLVLSGRDLAWQEAQQRLMTEGNFTSRPAFGLQALAETGIVPEIELSPDLQEVVAVTPRSFGGDDGREVVLQQTAVYRQGARNWLLSPPEESFWGRNMTSHTRYFTLTYPQRDEAWIERLTSDLSILLDTRVCDHLLSCHRVPLNILFSHNPQSLIAITDPLTLLRMGDGINLPTPTLVGLPVDEAGYEALLQGYGAQVVTAVIAHQLKYDCCERALMTHAVITKQISELGLQSWPLTPKDYKHLLNVAFGKQTANELLGMSDLSVNENRMQAYALVDFLMAERKMSIPQQLFALLTTEGTLEQDMDFNQRWLQYVYEQSENGRPPLPTAPPPPIQAACHGPQGTRLYHHDLVNGNQLVVDGVKPANIGTTHIWALPQAGNNYILYEEIYHRFETAARLTLHNDDEFYILLQHTLTDVYTLPDYVFLEETDPNGRYLFLLLTSPYNPPFPANHFLYDLSTCAHNRCPITSLAGIPSWSPDGNQTLLETWPVPASNKVTYDAWRHELARGNEAGQEAVAIGTGYAPVWLDENSYSYLRLNEANVPEWVVATVADDAPQVELEAIDLLTAVPDNARPEQLFMLDTAIAGPNQVAIIAATELLTDSLNYVFLWDRVGEPQLLQVGAGLQVAFSPNGRYLTITALAGTVTLIDLTTSNQQTFSSQVQPRWSADSQWLLTGHDSHLLLTAPVSDDQQIMLNGNRACYQVLFK